MQMTQRHQKQLLFLAIILLLVSCFMPAIFGSQPTIFGTHGADGWRSFIYDFQTLITGGLAILAAYLTIRAGQELDERQHARHQQVMAISVRTELRMLERAMHPQIDDVREIVEGLWNVNYDHKEPTNNNWKWYNRTTDRYVGRLGRLEEVIARQQFVDAVPFFDGHLTYTFTKFRKQLGIIRQHFQNHLDELERAKVSGQLDEYYEQAWEDNEYYYLEKALEFPALAEQFLLELNRTDSQYRTLLARHPY